MSYRPPEIREDGSEVLHYDNPDFMIFTRRNFLPANSNFPDMRIHWHNDLEFIYIRKGYADYKLNGKTVRLNEGEGIGINSKQLHLFISKEVDCEVDVLIFQPEMLYSSKHLLAKYVFPILEDDKRPYIYLSHDVDWQKDILNHMEKIVDYSLEKDKELLMISELTQMWNVLYENADVNKEYLAETDNGLMLVKSMLSYIHANYGNKITLDDVSRVGCVGRTTCTKLFEKYLNLTPIEYVIGYRLSKGMELLANTDYSISQIAYTIGFGSASYFTESFRNKIKMTPKEYRENLEKR